MIDALVIASPSEHPGADRVWGTGGWTPPEEREARDWVTLCRLLGWRVTLAAPPVERIDDRVDRIVLACPLEDVRDAVAAHLERRPALVVARADVARRTTTAGPLRWSGPGATQTWPLPDAPAAGDPCAGEPWLHLGELPVARARRAGQGTIVSLGVHPSALRDAGGAGTAALRRLLAHDAACRDLDGVVALRMDDPGGAQNVHLAPFAYRELGRQDWADIARVLRERDARMSVACVPAWVDDGDPRRGELVVDGRPAPRSPGRVHPSCEVVYRDAAGAVHDYAGEFHALRDLAAEGTIDVQLHGHTHVHPDRARWARAPDRYDNVAWYREFAEGGEDALDRGCAMLAEWSPGAPRAVVFPGDAWTTAALERAHELGLDLVASYYLALRDDRRFTWAEHVCAPYLDEPDPSWFEAGLPVVGYFHARDVALHGAAWLAAQLDAWREAGARRFVTLGDLAA